LDNSTALPPRATDVCAMGHHRRVASITRSERPQTDGMGHHGRSSREWRQRWAVACLSWPGRRPSRAAGVAPMGPPSERLWSRSAGSLRGVVGLSLVLDQLGKIVLSEPAHEDRRGRAGARSSRSRPPPGGPAKALDHGLDRLPDLGREQDCSSTAMIAVGRSGNRTANSRTTAQPMLWLSTTGLWSPSSPHSQARSSANTARLVPV
jgi:hypothetical protein